MRELAFVELCLVSALHAGGAAQSWSAVGVCAGVHACVCVCVCRQLCNYERRASEIPVEQISVSVYHRIYLLINTHAPNVSALCAGMHTIQN